MTVRSHDQYNTTIYGLNDRYRGITGRRDVLFMNSDDMDAIGIAHGEHVDVVAGPGRILRDQVAIRHDIARGSIAAYYPEANCLMALDDHDGSSGTPAYKAIAVRVLAAERQSA